VSIYAGLTDTSELIDNHFSDGLTPGPYLIEVTPDAVVWHIEGCPGGWTLVPQ